MKKFYQSAFGWVTEDYPEMEYVIAQTVEVDEERMPKEAGAINGSMMKRSEYVTSPSFAIDVQNIDQARNKVTQAGGTLLTEVIKVGDMGLMSYFKDTEGNVLSLWQTTRAN